MCSSLSVNEKYVNNFNSGNQLVVRHTNTPASIEKVYDATECPICLLDLKDDNKSYLDCGHVFCYYCLVDLCHSYYVSNMAKCPFCRQRINSFQYRSESSGEFETYRPTRHLSWWWARFVSWVRLIVKTVLFFVFIAFYLLWVCITSICSLLIFECFVSLILKYFAVKNNLTSILVYILMRVCFSSTPLRLIRLLPLLYQTIYLIFIRIIHITYR